jgi:D-inositol-3-phosphate glycosyltransferase
MVTDSSSTLSHDSFCGTAANFADAATSPQAQDRITEIRGSDPGGIAVALLTGGGDPHYAYGLCNSLLAEGATIELIGSDDFDPAVFHDRPRMRFLNLRGSVDPTVSGRLKLLRVLRYYGRLLRYAGLARPKIFHILWNNKFETFDRTLLMLYYRVIGKHVVLTAHNINAARRDGGDSWWNRLTLQIQYRLAHHLFVHTGKMAQELTQEFGVPVERITVIPFGINNAVPNTAMNREEARARLGLRLEEKVLLGFGRIAPYKGLEYLTTAFRQLRADGECVRLIIAGKVDDDGHYWNRILVQIRDLVDRGEILLKTEFIPDEETEVYFKAADALVLPYRHIYQSGILYLGQSYGLPVLAADVGSFRDEIIEGKSGFIFRAGDVTALIRVIRDYFASDLYRGLAAHRGEIQKYVAASHSWKEVAQITMSIYSNWSSGKESGSAEKRGLCNVRIGETTQPPEAR